MTYIYERVCGNCELTWQDASAHSGCPRCEANELREANRRLMEMRRDYIRAFAEPMRDGETVPDFARRCIATLEAERDALACLNGKEPMNGSFADACGVLASEFRREQAARIAMQAERDLFDRSRHELRRDLAVLRAEQQTISIMLGTVDPETGDRKGTDEDLAEIRKLVEASEELERLRLAKNESLAFDVARLSGENMLLRASIASLTEAAQNDAYLGTKFVGVFEVRGEKHLGYRYEDSDETITPLRESSYEYERGGSAPYVVILFSKDDGNMEDGDERYMGRIVNENDFEHLVQGRIPPDYTYMSNLERDAVHLAYTQLEMNTRLIPDDSHTGCLRAALLALLKRWGVEVKP